MKLSLSRFFKKDRWIVEGRTKRREYEAYEEYVRHQKSKLSQISNLERKSGILTVALRKRLGGIEGIGRGTSVLCLGARTGDECRVFIELGAFAVGIDLNPGTENRHVVIGDFHQIQFADASVDCVFTNCLEHAYEVERVIKEVHRVLRPGGIFIAEIVLGSEDQHGREPGEHDSIWWDRCETLIERIGKLGFTERSRRQFDKPWNGVQAVFLGKT